MTQQKIVTWCRVMSSGIFLCKNMRDLYDVSQVVPFCLNTCFGDPLPTNRKTCHWVSLPKLLTKQMTKYDKTGDQLHRFKSHSPQNYHTYLNSLIIGELMLFEMAVVFAVVMTCEGVHKDTWPHISSLAKWTSGNVNETFIY